VECENLLAIISERYGRALGENLVGIYAHGSIAFRCFRWDRSDVDFIAVAREPLSRDAKLRLLSELEDLRAQAPPKGFEMSVVLQRHCENFEHPTPYELHFSNGLLGKYLEDPLSLCGDERKTDFDLAAHFTVIAKAGVVLRGEPIGKVFAPVPKSAYMDSILRDVENAREDVAGNPAYVILNLCRVYAHAKDGLVLSKEEGARWGLENLPARYRGLVASALGNYVSGEPIAGDAALQVEFCGHVMGLLPGRPRGGRKV